MELFKYCKSEHRDMLLSSGCIRVGTLEDYRRTDKYGEMVSDQDEGKRIIGGSITGLSAENEHLYPGIAALRQSKLINIDLRGGGSVRNLTIGKAILESPDLLVFSASSEYSNSTHKCWHAAEGYDACYKILSARLFFRAISQALGPNYRFLGYAEVIYTNTIDLTDPRCHTHPALIKRTTEFSSQAEFRAVWALTTESESTKPVLLESSRAGLYASPYASL